MSAFPVAYRVAQAIGFTGAAWLSGKSWHLQIFLFELEKLIFGI
jgi:hypothetical protein